MTTDHTRDVGGETVAADESGSEEPSPSRCVEISIEDDRWDKPLPELEPLVPALVETSLKEAGLEPNDHCVTIAFMSDEGIRSLNKIFRGKDQATNVLSFPAAYHPQLAQGPRLLGDIAIAFETVQAEAAAENKTIVHHTAHLVVHGVLHLAGMDHDRDDDAEKMENAERIILSRFGISDPYAGADGDVTASTV
jgi:probable rRNA maturation factor